MESNGRLSPHGEGYIKVYRKLLTSAVFQDEGTLKVWMWCLLRANYTPRPLDFAGEEIELQRGEFITGRIHASDELAMSESRTWRILKKLEHWGNISIKSNNRFSVITIVNYDSYQSDNFVNGQQADNKRTTSEQLADNQRTQIKKDKKDKNQEEGKEGNRKPSSQEVVSGYFKELGEPDDSAAWWDHFVAVGWVIGKGRTPMKDWRAAVRTWIRNGKKWGNNGTGKTRQSITGDDFRRMVERNTRAS